MNLANLHITTWKETFQEILNHWESQWLLIDKSAPISNQESPAVCKSMLCNAIHSNPDFLQVEHLDKLRQAHGMSEITYHYLTLLHTTAFQLDLKRPKCSTHCTEVNNTNSTSNNNDIASTHGGKGCSQNNSCGGHGNDNKIYSQSQSHLLTYGTKGDSVPPSAKSTISQHINMLNSPTR